MNGGIHTMKKWISLIVVCLVFLSAGLQAAAAGFSDVPDSHRFAEDIAYVSGEGIVNGYKDGSFRPDAPVTRGETAIVLVNALGLEVAEADSVFEDVANDSAAAPYIAAATQIGILSGHKDGKFRPAEHVTRDQMAIMLAKAFPEEATSTATASDIHEGMSAYPFIRNLIARGIVQNHLDGTFRPNDAVTRGQLAAFVTRIMTTEPNTSEADASILYFNDAHNVSPVKPRGGVARLATVVDEVRTNQENTIVTFGGDLGGGSIFEAVFKGFPQVEAFNKIGIDYANFGQHDFDHGPDNTRALVEASEFQWLTSNLKGPDGSAFANLPTYSVEEKDGLKIVFLGLTDQMVTTSATDEVTQNDITESAKAIVAEALAAEGKVDLFVALTQQSLDKDKKLLMDVPEIGYIFSEEEYEDNSTIYNNEGRFIAKPEGNIGSVIRLDVKKIAGEVELNTSVIKLGEDVESNPELQKLAESYEVELEERLGEKIADLPNDLSRDNRLSHEQAIGNLITDSYRAHYEADIAFMNGGGIRDEAKAGDFTMKSAYAILPFGNKPILANVKGENIRAALENGVSQPNYNAFLHVSGMAYSYSLGKPVGDRVSDIKIAGEPLDDAQIYTVVMPNFLFNGGDGFTMFANDELLVAEDNAITDVELLINYVRELGVIDIEEEGRITVTE